MGDFLTESREAGSSGDVAKKLTVKLWGRGVEAKSDPAGSEHTQYYVRHAGQFIYSKLDFLNSAFGVIPEALEGYESTADLPAFDVQALNPFFLFLKTTQKDFYLKYGLIADGSRKAKRVHAAVFLEMPLQTPALSEQARIGSLFRKLDSLITLHQRECAGLNKAGNRAHDQINVLVLQFLDDVQVGLLRCVHAGMAKSLGDACDGHPRKEQQRCVGVPESVNGDDGNLRTATMPLEDAVGSRVVYLALNEDGPVAWQGFGELGELDDELPVELHLAHRRTILRGNEPRVRLVIPGLAYGYDLSREVEICRCKGNGLGEPQACLGDEQDEPIP